MAGVGQADVTPVSVGASAQPLVSSMDMSATSSPAIQNLTNAFQQGFINADDVIQRIGPVAQAKKKALLEELGEYVSPEQIEARKQAALSSAQTSQLGGAQASSLLAAGVPQAQAQTTAQIAAKSYAEGIFGKGSTDLYATAADRFGLEPVPKLANGQPDYVKMGRRGAAIQNYQYYNQALIPDPSKGTFQDVKHPGAVFAFSQAGIPLTPENITKYSKMRDAFEKELSGFAEEDQPEPSEPLVSAKTPMAESPAVSTPANDAVRATAVQKYGVSPAQAGGMSDRDLLTIQKLESQPQTRPEIQPVSQPQVATAPQAAFYPSKDVREEVAKSQDLLKTDARYTDWSKKAAVLDQFDKSTANYEKGISGTPGETYGTDDLNAFDKQLIHNVGMMILPQDATGITRFEGRLEEHEMTRKSWPQIIKNVPEIVLKTGTLTPLQRQHLIDFGQQRSAALKRQAGDAVQGQVSRMQSAFPGMTPEVAIPDVSQRALISGAPSASPPGSAAGPPSGSGSRPAGAPPSAVYMPKFNLWYDRATGSVWR